MHIIQHSFETTSVVNACTCKIDSDGRGSCDQLLILTTYLPEKQMHDKPKSVLCSD